MLPNSKKVKYQVGFDNPGKVGEILIIDEGDDVLFRDIKNFYKMIGKANVIMLSATSDNGDAEGSEAAVLQKLGFRMFKNQIFKDDRGDKAIIWEEEEMAGNESKLEFLKEELKQRAVIMFCESEFIDFIGHQLSYTQVSLTLSSAEMRRLDEKDGSSYKLIVSDDPNLMSRGIDFRGNSNGLTFLQAKAAPNKRALD